MSLPPNDQTVRYLDNVNLGPSPRPAVGSTQALPTGTCVGEFELIGLLGEGGFGIVYLAYDKSLERQVALKEYMPAAFAARAAEAQVRVRSEQNGASFEAGLRSFINEAKLLAQFDHPSLVKVYRFWEANGTAYMVMPVYTGPTLKQALLARPMPPDQAWLEALLEHLLDALDTIHQQQCFHRDVAPDNILVLEDGRPLLLDFGAARRAIGAMNQAFTVILKQGYAPIEQYAEMPGMRQGAWTDLYALASVMHLAIDGQPPPPAVARMIADPYVPLAQRYSGRFSGAFLAAIDRALAFKPDQRPQSVAAMRALLRMNQGQPENAAQPAAAAPPARVKPQRRSRAMGAIAAAALATAGSGYLFYSNSAPAPAAAASVTARMATAQPVRSATSKQAAPVPRLAPVSATILPAAPPPGPPALPVTNANVATTPAATAQDVPAMPATPAFDPVGALEEVLNGASLHRSVKLRVPKTRLRINTDSLHFSVRVGSPGYVYVLKVDGDRKRFRMLFPNAVDQNNHIEWQQVLEFPRPGWPLPAEGPPGTSRFVVMVSETRRDFREAGLVAGNPFSEFPIAQAGQLQRGHAGRSPLFAGVPTCAGKHGCSDEYGADIFSIEEFTP